MVDKLLNWTILSLKIHLNQKNKLWKNLGVLLVLLGNLQQVGFNENDLEIFRHKVWKILNFEQFLSLEIKIKQMVLVG
jgi:hypothetical protein